MVQVGHVVNRDLLPANACDACACDFGCADDQPRSPVPDSFFPNLMGWAFLRRLDRAEATRSESSRRRSEEFLAGRQAAYIALCRAGFQDSRLSDRLDSAYLTSLVAQQADRSPSWPAGFVGSISHSRNWIMAASASSCIYASIGVDTEAIATQEQTKLLQQDVGQPTEWSLLQTAGVPMPTAFTLLFSAKEAFYKCWYPLRRSFLNFDDVVACQIEPDRHSPCADSQSGLLSMECRLADNLRLKIHYHISLHDVFTITTKDPLGS